MNWKSVGGSGGAWKSWRLTSSSITMAADSPADRGRSRRATLATMVTVNSTTATCQARCLRRPSWPARNSSSSPTSMVTTRPLTRSGRGT